MKNKRDTISSGTVRYFLICFLIFYGGFIQKVFSQNYADVSVSLEVKDKTLKEVLDRLEKITGVHFFYDHARVNPFQTVSVKAENVSLRKVLEQMLQGTSIGFEFQNNGVVVLVTQQPQEIKTIKLTGKVVDESNGEPLLGASVVFAGDKTKGVVTDVNGKFTLEVPDGISGIVVSFVGYGSATVKITPDKGTVTVKLTPTSYKMEDAVVTGMGIRKTSSFTGSYVQVSGEQLRAVSPNNLLKALQFFDPSFKIMENNSRGSDPNTLPDFKLRGDAQLGAVSEDVNQMSLLLDDYSNRPNMPLFVLDGFETSLTQIVDLDPDRVESITLLKDATATAIYGSKAANGVVVFETKIPRQGALNISYSGNYSISIPDLTDYNLLNAEEKLDLEWKAGFYSPDNAQQMNRYNRYKHDVLKGVNTYWLSQPLRTAFTHRHSLSFEGGDKVIRYRLGLSYNSNPGVMKESDRTGMGLDFTLSYRKNKFNISNNLRLNNTEGNNTPYGSFSAYTKLNPYYRVTDENGEYLEVLDDKAMTPGTSPVRIYNPLYNTQFKSVDVSKNLTLVDNLSLQYTPFESLRLTANVSFTKGIVKKEVYKSPHDTSFEKIQDLTKRGSYKKNIGENVAWNANFSANYNLTKDRHVISAMARYTVQTGRNESTEVSATGYPNDEMSDFLFGYEMNNRVSGEESTSRSLGALATLSYMYDYRYAIDGTIRCDLSSKFGDDNRFAPFWSVGARWNISREHWLESNVISDLTLRASYGITGSQSYSSYQAAETYSFKFKGEMFPYISSSGLGARLMGIGNKDLGWAKTRNINLVAEVSLWENRFNISFTYYNSNTDNLLLDYTLAPSVGFGSMKMNAGALENNGYEIDLTVTPYRNAAKQMWWSVTFNGAHNTNKVKKISNALAAMNKKNLETNGAPLPVYVEGESTTRIFLVPSLGIDPLSGEEWFMKRNGNKTFEWNAADAIPVGDTEPEFSGSFGTSFNYKELNIGLSFSYEWGAQRYNSTLVEKIENASLAYNVDRRALTERWSAENPHAKYKSLTLIGHQTKRSTRFLEDFHEIRLGSVNVGYRFTSANYNFLKRCGISNIKVSTTLEDVFRVSSVKQERGLDYPFARMLNLSLAVLFL